MSLYTVLTFEEVTKLTGSNFLLIITATIIEEDSTIRKLKPLEGHSKIILTCIDGKYYHVGLLGAYQVYYVQCDMGSNGANGSLAVTKQAITLLKPKLVIMVGIAFGVDTNKQTVGDVLVAKVIQPYDLKKVDHTGKTFYRGVPLTTHNIINERFKMVLTQWNKEVRNYGIDFCEVLSGCELINYEQRRNELVQNYPGVKGGEMEGEGLYSACKDIVPCVLVKGICDFADGNKDVNKDNNQLIAVENALNTCLEFLNCKHIFLNIQLYPLKVEADLINGSSLSNLDTIFINEIFETKKSTTISKMTPINDLVFAFVNLSMTQKLIISRSLGLYKPEFNDLEISVLNKEIYQNIVNDGRLDELWMEIHKIQPFSTNINPFSKTK